MILGHQHPRRLVGGLDPKIGPLRPDVGNSRSGKGVYRIVNRASWWAAPLLIAVSLGAASSAYQSAEEKFTRIESDRLRAGSRVELTAGELTAYVEHTAPTVTDGVRNPSLQLVGPGVAKGAALIDFAKVQRSQGHAPGWLMSKLLEGERPVSVTARIRSSGGTATVDVERVEISGIVIDGKTLDFLIDNILLPLYPNAVVGKPFELGHRIERLDVGPRTVGVVIGK
jgi:hypothetical protein